jgi:hypothetical protein
MSAAAVNSRALTWCNRPGTACTVVASPWVKHKTLIAAPEAASTSTTAPRPKLSSSGCATTVSTERQRGSLSMRSGMRLLVAVDTS